MSALTGLKVTRQPSFEQLKDVRVNHLISGFFRFTLKLVLAALGLVFVFSLLAAALVVVVFSLLKSLITGKKSSASVAFNRFQQFSPKGMWPGAAGREAQNNSAKAGDVVDVEVREIRGDK